MYNMLQKPPYSLAAATAQTKVTNAVGSSYFAASNNYYAGVGTRPALGAVWDTWTWWYERDGIDQNGRNGPDEGTNGLDDPDASGNYVNGVDDAGEREANPPYARALRGLEVKIRMYEPGTRQVRQATVGTDFVAE